MTEMVKQIGISFTLSRLQGLEFPRLDKLSPQDEEVQAVRTLLHMVNPRYDHEILTLTRIDGRAPNGQLGRYFLRVRTALNGARVMLEGTSQTWWGAVVRAYASQGGWRGRFNHDAARAATAVYAQVMGLQDAKLVFDFRDEAVNLPVDGNLSRWPIENWVETMERTGDATPGEFLAWFRTVPEPPTDADVMALGDELDRMVLP